MEQIKEETRKVIIREESHIERYGEICPLMALETIRDLFLTNESDWLQVSSGNVFADIEGGQVKVMGLLGLV